MSARPALRIVEQTPPEREILATIADLVACAPADDAEAREVLRAVARLVAGVLGEVK